MINTTTPMRETLTRTRESEYFTRDGLRTLTGLEDYKWDYAIVKELLDNALDAVNDLDEKRVSVYYDGITLRVCDNGPGISPDALDKVYDFSLYVSSKHNFRTPTRGMQGNALKTIIGICFLREYALSFAVGSKIYHYEINKTLLDAGYVSFAKWIEQRPRPSSDGTDSCVIVQFIEYDENGDPNPAKFFSPNYVNFDNDDIKELIWKLHLANPDVTFRYNDTIYEAVSSSKKYTDKTFIHWYDFAAFNQLLQAVAVKDPHRTVKDFCLKFSGTQRILSKLEFPHKRLNEFNDDPAAIKSLLKELKAKTKAPRPEIFKGMLSGETAFMSMFRARDDDDDNYSDGDSADDGQEDG
jgi:hypothetical protein